MSKKCMVFETLGSITEMKKQKLENSNEIRLSGVFGVCGVKNNNRRTYSKENYGQMIECLQKDIMTKGVLGELEHPESMNINLNNVSHKIESVEMQEDGTITGTILLLNTDKGRNAKAIVEAGVPLYISSRALGNIDNAGNVTLTSLTTYDLVGTPGFSQAKLEALKESNMTVECLNESCYAIMFDDEIQEAKDEVKDEEGKKEKEKTSNKDDDEKDSNNITINVNDEAQSENEDKKDKKENKDNNKAMEDLTNKVQELIDKVTNLEASLHVAKESLEQKTKEVEDLKEQLKPKYDEIERWVKEEFGVRFKTELVKEISEGVEKYTTQLVEENNNKINAWITKEFAPLLEEWTIKEFSPMVESWVTKEFGPVVENWANTEFASTIDEWATKEFANKIEEWITEEFSPIIEKWTVEHYGNRLNEWVEEHVKPEIINTVNENVSDYMEEQLNNIKESKFQSIDSMLAAIEGSGSEKNIAQVVIEKANEGNNRYAQFYAVVNMPNEYRPLWEMLSEARKDEIAMTSRAYNYTQPGVLEKFWSNVDFNVTKTVNENNHQTVVSPTNAFANNIVAQMKKLRNF